MNQQDTFYISESLVHKAHMPKHVEIFLGTVHINQIGLQFMISYINLAQENKTKQ